jgi:heme exporter protein A
MLEQDREAQPANAARNEPPSAVIEARRLSKSIDDRAILRDLNFAICPGELVGILGANGAGKTTLLRILAGLIAPTSGEVRLFGKELQNTASAVRGRIGMIGHQAMLYRDLSVKENLEFFARLYGLKEPAERASEMLERAGLLARENDPVKALSRGMVQRIAIARALLHEPQILLSDEPFAGLDAPSSRGVERLFAALTDSGRTVVLVNHDIEQTLRVAQRVIVLRGGSIIIDEPTHRLYPEEVLAEVSAS